MSQRTYSEREVAAIIARAAERERMAAPHDEGPGLTLDEIERAGREAGLAPEALRAAAADLDAGMLGDRPERTSLAERWVDGPLRPEAWEDVVAALRLRFGSTAALWWSAPAADTARVGAGQEWTHTDASSVQTTVSVSPRGDRTRVRVVQVDNSVDIHTRGQAALFAGVIGLIPAMLLGALLAETLGMGDVVGVAAVLVVLALSVGPGGVWLGRRADRDRARRRARQSADVQRLADEVARGLAVAPGMEESAGAVEALAPGAQTGPRLDLSPLDPEAESPADAAPTRDRRTRA